jgi:cytochrome P450
LCAFVCSYLRQFQNEVIRLAMPYVTYALRYAEHETTIGEYTVPPLTPVWQRLSGPFFDEKYFPNATVFDPEHFAEKAVRARPPCAFEPFGIGKRKCPGYKVSFLECSIVIVHMLRNFNVRLASDTGTSKKVLVSVLPESEIFVLLEKR